MVNIENVRRRMNMTNAERIIAWAEDILTDNLWGLLTEHMPDSPEPAVVGAVEVVPDVWYGGNNIMCRDEETAEALADWLDNLGYTTNTGYYDPEEDKRENCVDKFTGWYYVTV